MRWEVESASGMHVRNSKNLLTNEDGVTFQGENPSENRWTEGPAPHHPQCAGYPADGETFFIYLRDTFDYLYDEGVQTPKMMSVGLHCRLAGRPSRAAGLYSLS